MHKLDENLHEVEKIFSATENKYEAHLRSHNILRRMAEDEEVIFEVLRRNMVKPNFFNLKRCTPDFPLWLIERPEFSVHAFFFGPNRDKRTDISYSTMHTHCDHMLSTINVKGPGYQSLIFKQGYKVNNLGDKAIFELEKYSLHSPSKIEFLQNEIAHTVFYPEATTLTYGLWSTHFPTKSISKFKKSKFIQKYKGRIKGLMNKVNVKPASLGLTQYKEDYFYPNRGEIVILNSQLLPHVGDHFVQNFFNHINEFVGFSDKKFLHGLCTHLKKQGTDIEIVDWVEKSIENEVIERNYESYNMYLDKRNVSITEYDNIYKFLN
ncbi:MAG: hypothetical protein V3V00_04250 [Saprospiraceae bacterium]